MSHNMDRSRTPPPRGASAMHQGGLGHPQFPPLPPPPQPPPRGTSSSLVTSIACAARALASGTGPQQCFSFASYFGIHAWPYQNRLPWLRFQSLHRSAWSPTKDSTTGIHSRLTVPQQTQATLDSHRPSVQFTVPPPQPPMSLPLPEGIAGLPVTSLHPAHFLW